ncbi:hypothetical protein D3C81_1116940 [compost metagenome]
MRAGGEGVWIEVGLATQLHDALGKQAGMCLLLLCVLQEFGFHRIGEHALGHVVVPVVAKHAYPLGGQRIIEQLDHCLAVGTVSGCYRTILNALACVGTQGRAITDACRLRS